jgi:hypothetical protein
MGLSDLRHIVRPKLFGLTLILLWATLALADGPTPAVAQLFPASLGSFTQTAPAMQLVPGGKELFRPDIKEPFPELVAQSEYASADGEKLLVMVIRFENDSTAYSNLSAWRKYQGEQGRAASVQVDNVGTANALVSTRGLAFFKGPLFVVVNTESGKSSDQMMVLARLFSATLDSGEGDIPVLVKHLPNWETVQKDVVYAVSPSVLEFAIPNQPVLKEISFEGGTEAAAATYGQSQMVIVEFTTPQFSVDNDRRIVAKLQELKSQAQPAPSAYRRVGNYSVFVFNAADEQTANELIDQVKYQQVVQWLGDDPRMADRLQRYFQHTTAGVLMAVLKSSGLSLILCFGVGALFGALLFRHRRGQQATLYSDAGGAVRLNLDELTGPGHSHKLLEPGEQPESDPTGS